jgi:hypothetical protein
MMRRFGFVILLVCVAAVSCVSFSRPFGPMQFEQASKESGLQSEPVYLSEFLDRPHVAQQLAYTSLFGGPSYAGFLTVNKTYDSNMVTALTTFRWAK